MGKKKRFLPSDPITTTVEKTPWLNYHTTIVAIGGSVIWVLICGFAGIFLDTLLNPAYWYATSFAGAGVIFLVASMFFDRRDLMSREIKEAIAPTERELNQWKSEAAKAGITTPKLLGRRLSVTSSTIPNSQATTKQKRKSEKVTPPSDSEYISKIAELESQVSELKHDKTKLERDLQSSKNIISSNSRKLQDNLATIKSLKKTLARRERTLEERRSVTVQDIKPYEEQLAASQVAIDRLNCELVNLKAEHESALAEKSRLLEMKVHTDTTNCELESLQQRLKELHAQVEQKADLETQLESYKLAISKSDEELQKLTKDLEIARDFFASEDLRLKKLVDDQQKEIAELSEIARKKDESSVGSSKKVAEMVEEMEILKEQQLLTSSKYESRIAELQNEAESKAANLENTLSTLCESNTALEARQLSFKSELDRCNVELVGAKAEIQKIQAFLLYLGSDEGPVFMAMTEVLEKLIVADNARDFLENRIASLSSPAATIEVDEKFSEYILPFIDLDIDQGILAESLDTVLQKISQHTVA